MASSKNIDSFDVVSCSSQENDECSAIEQQVYKTGRREINFNEVNVSDFIKVLYIFVYFMPDEFVTPYINKDYLIYLP